MQPNIIKRIDEASKKPGEECWISALHTVYHANCSDVKSDLAEIYRAIEPDAGFITTFKGKSGLTRNVSPFEDAKYSLDFQDEPELCFNGELDCVTQWRKCIRPRIEKSASSKEEKTQIGGIWVDTLKNQTRFMTSNSLLNGSVEWKNDKIGTPFALIYTRK